MVQEAVDALINGVEWNRARKVASEYQSDLVPYVDEKYKTYLKNEGNAEQVDKAKVLCLC